MDNEEKYKKLIRAIKVLRDLKPHDECLENWIKENAPEIAEQEDERIRERLIEFFKDWGKTRSHCWSISISDILAWLEKQDPKKHQEELDAAYKTADKVQYKRGYEDAVKEMEKQGWNKDDESYLNTTIAYLKDAKEFKKTAENCINWLKSLRPQPKQEKPPMQNGIIINGVEYELIEDREDKKH